MVLGDSLHFSSLHKCIWVSWGKLMINIGIVHSAAIVMMPFIESLETCFYVLSYGHGAGHKYLSVQIC